MTAAKPGRRKGTSESRQEILEAARALFAQHGYQRTTIRLIAERAGVDPSLVIYYFLSKEHLFAAAMPEPSEAALAAPKLMAAMPKADAARAIGLRILEAVNSPGTSNVLGIIRAASSKPEAVAQLREVFVSRMMLPMITELGLSRPKERAVLLSSIVTGMTFVHEMLDIKIEWPTLDETAELELIAKAIELVLTVDLD
ncbi:MULTISPECIES: TetR/AcrR family transcriptional regulator [unclassified Arthrobacter]|uniref:TetR/AcrR family transcriptional regulator n=1 Tax=unclassified Arthrobacter TaxID=235627 RepID=UPI002E011CE4|nr:MULTISPECIES: TetR family transcriptional regulator [unclassified Arthrobacter]MEC5191272.1 AcrR family transcriptional regulator [Arthrobacter sp. MP_M4]MEC5202489.1 AcrR family transcriptional regulator [Arthrobacter sp. MP_M7]